MRHTKPQTMTDSPVEQLRKELPRGDGSWRGFSYVYTKISEAAAKMGTTRNFRLNEFHVRTMAILGCGHEETMKAHLGLLRIYDWV